MAILPTGQPWKFPKVADLQSITVKFKTELAENEPKFQPYLRDEKLVRPWAVPKHPDSNTGLEAGKTEYHRKRQLRSGKPPGHGEDPPGES